MLERLAAWVLNSYIGEYFGNVNTDQLSVALQRGEVELEGLPLKVDALKHWGLPINVKAGYIGKIQLKIPVYRIRSEPCLILVEELYLVAHPITDFTYNEDVEKKIMQDYKMNLLDSLELKFQSQYESLSEANYYQSSYSSWLSATTSFVTNIVENLQLKIKSVHVRYENVSNSPRAQFACGIVIKNLSIQSTDNEWNPKFVYRDTATDMRKLVNLDDFNIYWDNNAVFVGDYNTPEFVSAMRTLMVTSITKDNLLDNHDFILTSVTGQAKMKKNCSEKPLRSCNEPRLTFDLQLESFPLSLNIIQYRQLMDWIEISSRNNRIWKHRKYRPNSSIKEKPAEWWKYAMNVHMTNYRTKNERLKWDFVLKRATDIKEYFNAYYNYLLHPESLNSATKLLKERIEYDLSFDELCCLRELVYDKIKRNKEDVKIENKNKEVSSWYQNWFSGWYGEQPTGTDDLNNLHNNQMKRDLSESFDIETEIQKSLFELEEEFVNIFDTIENDTFLKRDAVFAQVNLVIQNASFTLLSSFSDLKQNFTQLNKATAQSSKNSNNNKKEELRPILEIEFRSVEVGVEARPRYCSHEFKIKLGELYIKDTLSEEAVRSNRRYLMSSEFDDVPTASNLNNQNSNQFKTDFVSTSCPSIPTEFNLNNLENYASLPSKLHNQSIYQMLPKRKKKISKVQQPNADVKKVIYESESCPTTPIATPKRGLLDKKEDLVKITLLFIDKSSPLFEKKFGGINRFVNIEFNRLETNVIIDTWSVIMNFFSSATEHSVLVESLDLSKNDALDEALGKDWSNSKIDITVNELSLVLYKSESEQLAKIGISNFNCFSTTTNGNMTADGSLGKVTVIDLTLSGKVYKERFITAGEEALNFNFFKHCGKNLEFKTDYDMKLDCQMSLVQYVHSQRFFMELLNFWHLFNSMDSLGSSNLNSNNLINSKIQSHQNPHQLPGSPKKPKRGSRLSLNVNADAPVIIIPINSLCDHVLVADFGKLEVRNRFAYAGSQNTISTVCKKSGLVHSDLTRNFKKPTGVVTRTMTSDILNKLAVVKSPTLCLLDVVNLSLTEMDLYKGVLVNLNEDEKSNRDRQKCKNKDTLYFPSFKIKRLPGKILKERFKLKLQLERNLDGEFSRSVPDITMKGTFSTVHCTLNPSTYQLIRGIIEHNLGEPINHLKQVKPIIVGREGLNVVLSNHIWTSMATHLELNNVTVEIVNNSTTDVVSDEQKLARIDFVSSNLSIESFTDSSKDIDLVSQEIRVIDTRYEHMDKSNRPNIFLNILQSKGSNKGKNSNKNPLQIEIHYRSKPDLACLTVLLNNMRIMAIFDWFKAMSDFLMQTFNFETMATFNSEVASHFQQLLEYQSLHCPCFELKLNIMDTEFVVVEDSSKENTHAVILRGTSVLNLTTDDNDGEPFNCSLERLEVFSCVIGAEQEQTSLSIVDPLNITISLTSKAISLFGQRDDISSEHILIVDIMSVNTRLSFNDLTLILKILNSLPKQTESFTTTKQQNKNLFLKPSNNTSGDLDDSIFALPSHVNQLQSLGFDRQDCGLALEACQGNINDAAIWLAQNSKALSRLDSPDYDQHAFQFVKIGRFHKLFTNHLNIRIQNGNFTLIDDCKNIDVPLFEVKLTKLNSLSKFGRKQLQIECNYTLTCDYYNRALSGWEPFIEPWQNKVQFKLQKEPSKKIVISFESTKTLNFVITNTFLNLYKSVYQTWSDEYQKLCNEGHYNSLKNRSPFIPFALKNETGCVLNFSLLAYTENYVNSRTKHIIGTSIDKIRTNKTITYGGLELDVIEVDPGKTVPFAFEAPTKIRHQDSHMPRSHKIIVQVDGWYEMFPVSVDKVGVYFREAKPKDIRLETSRIVFDITLEPNAVKLITVRSALIVHNQLNTEIELSFNTVTKNTLIVGNGKSIPIPLKLVRSMIHVRPCNVNTNLCRSFIEWEHIKKQGESNSQLFKCTFSSKHANQPQQPLDYSIPNFFCVHTIRDNFPLDNCQNSVGMVTTRTLPGHHIYILAPLEIVNLLPLELKYYLQNLPVGGTVKPGESSLQYINTQADFTINFLMDNYTKSNSLVIKPGASKDFFMHLEMYDKKGKLLLLQTQICLVTNNALGLKILISAPYWFVNKTGLPLVFKQEGTDQEASGQFEEHEIARCILPLLYSFYDADASLTCIMRLGRSLGKSKWSVGFYLEPKGIRVRRVRIASDDSRKPDKVFEIGIEVQNGKGRYKDTKIVTFSPRYQIENLSSFKLQIAQKCTISTQAAAQPIDSFINVLPNSNMPFHWPRTDQDKLLCVKIIGFENAIEQYHWSGGFGMIPNSSFHLNVRDLNGKCTFLRVEILQTGATVFIVIQNAFNLPPPIRIDNYSEVQIEFYQTDTLSLWNKSVVRPKSSFNYALDEPTAKPHITISAPGGSACIYDLSSANQTLGNSFRPGNLTYENFIYIAFTGTFIGVDATELNVKQNENIHNMQLVLEVCEGSNTVILNRKEPGRRSQLWRMDSVGRLIHEGSSPPLDPRKSQQANVSINENALVLDISSQYCKPGEYTALMLRKINPKRSYTQTWHFMKDGRLKCEFDGMYVQPQNGFLGLKKGNIVVLGPTQPVSYLKLEGNIQFEQAICTQKMRKGSGMLTVQVLSDGPTRVLQILDVRNMASNRDEQFQLKRYSLSNTNTPKKDSKDLSVDEAAKQQLVAAVQKSNQEYQLLINTAGIGISIVNPLNEELVYVYTENVIVDYCNKINEHFFNCSIKYIQTDNQLIDAEKSIVFYTMDLEESNPNAHLPAISISAHKLISPNLEAHFFEQVQIKIKDVILNIEEQLLLKLYDFFGYGQVEKELELIKGEIETRNMHIGMTSSLNQCSRIYFSLLEIELNKIRLSVFTSSHFSDDLLEIKRRTGLRLMRFEDAKIFLEPFRKAYSLETFSFLMDAIVNHYRKELKGQAAKILGSVDFLGNPLGFMNDVTDGITELIDGNIGGLFVNISHGISDSTAKFTSVLSDSLGAVTLDSRHQEIRKRIKQESSNGPIKAGLVGLGIGLLGGLTSIVTQTYEGAVQQGGVQGVVTGFGRGVLGTFTKPAVGVLDLATSAASMMRDRSRKISSQTGLQSLTRGQFEDRIRMPRQSFDVCGHGTLLPRYNEEQAAGQDFFYKSSLLFDKDEDEVFASFKNTFGNEYSVLITSDRVRFLYCDDKKNLRKRGIRAQITVDLINLIRADTISISVVENGLINHYLQLTVKDESHINRYGYYANVFYDLKSKKPSIKCTNDVICNEMMQQINHAKSYYDERKYTLTPILKTI